MQYYSQVMMVEYADAYAEFPPNIGNWKEYDYHKWNDTDDYHLGVTLNFDNTPCMSQGNPAKLPKTLSKNRTLPNHQPMLWEFWEHCFSHVCSWYKETKAKKAVLFFAWNKWSEQVALEPSNMHHYGYLEALRDCRLNVSDLEVPPLLDALRLILISCLLFKANTCRTQNSNSKRGAIVVDFSFNNTPLWCKNFEVKSQDLSINIQTYFFDIFFQIAGPAPLQLHWNYCHKMQ